MIAEGALQHSFALIQKPGDADWIIEHLRADVGFALIQKPGDADSPLFR